MLRRRSASARCPRSGRIIAADRGLPELEVPVRFARGGVVEDGVTAALPELLVHQRHHVALARFAARGCHRGRADRLREHLDPVVARVAAEGVGARRRAARDAAHRDPAVAEGHAAPDEGGLVAVHLDQVLEADPDVVTVARGLGFEQGVRVSRLAAVASRPPEGFSVERDAAGVVHAAQPELAVPTGAVVRASAEHRGGEVELPDGALEVEHALDRAPVAEAARVPFPELPGAT